MSRATIIQTYENQTAVLEYTDTFLLLNSECSLSIDFRASNIKNKEGILNSWKLIFVFTDDVPKDKKALTASVTSEDDGKTFIFTYYKWYGTGVENVEPHTIKFREKEEWFLIKINTSALESNKKRRTIHISIWRK